MAAKTAVRGKAQRGSGLFCYGRWPRRIDHRRRIALPPKFRREFGKDVVIVEENEGFLVFPRARLHHDFDDLSKVWIIAVDNQGRIGIPPVINYLKREIVWLGRGDHFEVLLS